MHKLRAPNKSIASFMFAGRAKFTIKSLKSGDHLTYKVKRAKDNENLFFVSCLHDGSIEERYSYVGYIRRGYNSLKLTAKSKFVAEDRAVAGFNYLCKAVGTEVDLEDQNLEFYHTGSCCRCGRELTDPESIERGIGPECIKKM